ncbi:MAG: exosortase system-associated protein, TIGR04073 family [Candidatus Omnitrophica bacterium]|jgi:putative exosortase-associated protein (TIGR04073 family)|nr:exosortase system-associated protein, TIGR04073 family [Candidatus Omnitrophota bacterium]
MKALLVLICILSLALPAAAFAQTGEEAGLVSHQLRDFQQYNPQMIKPTIISSDFLKAVNKEQMTYQDSPIEKGGVGTINTLTVWTDIPREMFKTSEESNMLMGATIGFGKGIMYAFARGAAGLYDITTCGLPPYDKPLVKPEYKVNHPQREGLKLTVFEW